MVIRQDNCGVLRTLYIVKDLLHCCMCGLSRGRFFLQGHRLAAPRSDAYTYFASYQPTLAGIRYPGFFLEQMIT